MQDNAGQNVKNIQEKQDNAGHCGHHELII